MNRLGLFNLTFTSRYSMLQMIADIGINRNKSFLFYHKTLLTCPILKFNHKKKRPESLSFYSITISTNYRLLHLFFDQVTNGFWLCIRTGSSSRTSASQFFNRLTLFSFVFSFD